MSGLALRRCLLCRLKFCSSCSGERYCPSCRKRHRNRLQSGVEVIPCTAAMERHMQTIEMFGAGRLEPEPSQALVANVGRYLDDPGADFDDSEIYDLIDKASRPKKRRAEKTWATRKTVRPQAAAATGSAQSAEAPAQAPEESASSQSHGATASPGSTTKVRTNVKSKWASSWDDEMPCG